MSTFIGEPIGFTDSGKAVYPVAGGSEFQGQEYSGTEGTATEPAETRTPWADYLEPLPESVRPLVEPTFRKWDADTTQRFQTYSQELKSYEPWKEPIEQFGSPEIAQQAFALMQALNDEPERVYQLLQENYGFGDQGNEEPESESIDDYVDPRVQSLEQMTEAMAEILLAQENAAQQAQMDAELDAELNGLREKHGEFDEEYVLTLMAGNPNLTGDQAVERYKGLFSNYVPRTAQQPPTLLGGGGGLPSQAIDPGTLANKDIKSMVAQMLAQAANQNQE